MSRPGPRNSKSAVLARAPGATCAKTIGKFLVSASDGTPIGFGATAAEAWASALKELAA